MQERLNNLNGGPGITLVIGGTGKTGRRVATRLAALGRPVRVGSRAGTPAFDWDDRGTWTAALAGVSAVYITFAPDLAVPGASDAIRAFVETAVAAGVQRLVLLSGRGEPEAQACEGIVQQAGVAWTIVRASWFSQNFSEGAFVDMVNAGTIALPAGPVPEPFVDADDIADVAVAALTETGHEYEVYEVTGPRLMTFDEAAQAISHAAGREIRFAPVSQDAFIAALSAAGTPDDYLWLLDYLFGTVLDGRNARLGDGVQRALGRAPKDFSLFARQAAASGAWDAASDHVAA